MTSPLSIRIATSAYRVALRLCGRSASESRRADMLRTFTDACRVSWQRGGATAVTGRAFAELWDLAGPAIGFDGRPAARVSVPAAIKPLERASRSGDWAIGTDLRHAWRSLLGRRADALLVVCLLALGLATTASVFGVADALLLHPVPFPDSDRLMQVWSAQPEQKISMPSMPLELAPRWLERSDLFVSGGISRQTSALVTDHGEPAVIPATLLSPGLLETLGVRPVLGRTFAPGEGVPGANRLVILSDDVWTSRFGRARDAIGRKLRINGTDHTVIGVMPADFRFPYERQRLWLPIAVDGAQAGLATLTVRLRPGVSVESARQQVEAAGPGVSAQARKPWRYGASLTTLNGRFLEDSTRRSIWLLFGSTALLLVMVCLNVANLGMARVFMRIRDAAIRSALGGSRFRLLRQSLAEELLVGLAALALALPLTMAGLRVAQALVPAGFTFTSLHVIGLDGRVLTLMIVMAFATPILAGLAPALAGSRPGLVDALRTESRSSTATRGSWLFRQTLVVVEVACAVVLLVSAALLGRSFMRLQQTNLGFDSRNLVSVNLEFPYAAFPTGVSRDLFIDQAVERIGHLDGITSVTPASGVPPINGMISFGSLLAEGQEGRTAKKDNAVLSGYDVRPEFFATMGIALKSGRLFMPGEDKSHVIVGESLAAMLWPLDNPIGKRFRWDDDPPVWSEVVGVAATIQERPDSPQLQPQIYLPLQRSVAPAPSAKPPAPRPATADPMGGYMRVAVRTTDPVAAMPLIRQAVRAIDPAVVVQAVERVDDELARELDRPRFLLALMLVFAGAGLALSAAGTYGVLSCLVSQRMREIGVRLMLGAEPRAIARGVIGGGLATVAIGVGLGLCVAAAVARVLGSLLFNVELHDGWSYAVVATMLLLAGVAASWRPARRAMNADPMALMRGQ